MPPQEYVDLILVPAILNTPTVVFHAQPWVVQERTRRLLLQHYIPAGWGGKPEMIERNHA